MNLRITYVEQDIIWENRSANLQYIEYVVAAYAEKSDIIVFPEMCTTGFSSNADLLAERLDGDSIRSLKEMAIQYDVALVGSLVIKDEGTYYNRGFFITPIDEYYYDKRHLFSLGAEIDTYSAGNKKLIIKYKSFHICLLICYDLRFPVWSRNVDNGYDLLIFVANWPKQRIHVWDTLLKARAIENVSYVCGVNRLGQDGMGIEYNGHSKVFDAKGLELLPQVYADNIFCVEISKESLELFRSKFPVWKDADKFEIF